MRGFRIMGLFLNSKETMGCHLNKDGSNIHVSGFPVDESRHVHIESFHAGIQDYGMTNEIALNMKGCLWSKRCFISCTVCFRSRTRDRKREDDRLCDFSIFEQTSLHVNIF
mmetsp:Transcript_42742/g.89733  ORF Transcript_42742/g.89733 Transcript_42742/m.89733 type:complete len:111 (+) Transcript_42742:33-365(+)